MPGTDRSAAAAPPVSVVVPVYRNAETLEELHRRLDAALGAAGVDFELVFVEDACPAGSLAVLRRLEALDPRVGVLPLPRNVGQHAAVLRGLARARGRAVVVMDADLQDPPDAVPALLARLAQGPAAVFAGRRGRYESLGRLATSRLFKRALHVLLGLPADAGMFVAMDRRMVERVLAMDASRPFVVAMIGCAGLPLDSLPVARAPRPSGRSAYRSWRRLAVGVFAMSWAFGYRLRARRSRA